MPIPLSPELIIGWCTFALIVAYWGHSRGSSFLLVLFGALLLSPLLMALAVAVTPVQKKAVEDRQISSGEMKKCPFCAELIRAEATKCRFCNEMLAEPVGAASDVAVKPADKPRRWNDW